MKQNSRKDNISSSKTLKGMETGFSGLPMKKNVKVATKFENCLMNVDAKKLLIVAKAASRMTKGII